MTAGRTPWLVLALLVGAIALAGCGGGSDSEEMSDADYVEELQDIATTFGAEANKLSKQVSELDGLNLQNAAVLLDIFSDSVEALGDEIDDIDPPEVVAQLHAQLLAQLESFGAKAKKAALALKAGDLLGGIPALSDFAVDAIEVTGKVDSTITDIKARLGLD